MGVQKLTSLTSVTIFHLNGQVEICYSYFRRGLLHDLTLAEIQSIIVPIAKKYCFPAAYLFGSYVRGTAIEKSDVDILVDTTGTKLEDSLPLGRSIAIWRILSVNLSML